MVSKKLWIRNGPMTHDITTDRAKAITCIAIPWNHLPEPSTKCKNWNRKKSWRNFHIRFVDFETCPSECYVKQTILKLKNDTNTDACIYSEMVYGSECIICRMFAICAENLTLDEIETQPSDFYFYEKLGRFYLFVCTEIKCAIHTIPHTNAESPTRFRFGLYTAFLITL